MKAPDDSEKQFWADTWVGGVRSSWTERRYRAGGATTTSRSKRSERGERTGEIRVASSGHLSAASEGVARWTKSRAGKVVSLSVYEVAL